MCTDRPVAAPSGDGFAIVDCEIAIAIAIGEARDWRQKQMSTAGGGGDETM